MNFIFVGLIFLFSTLSVYSQDYRLGFTADILTENKNLDYQFGPSIQGEFDFREIPISIKGRIGYYLSSMSDDNNLSGLYTLGVVSTGLSFNYYPIDWYIEPFIGLGFVLNSYEMSRSGDLHAFATGIARTPELDHNTFSTEVNLGLRFSARSWINFLVETAYTFNKPMEIISTKNRIFISKERVNFNSLFVRAGFLFKL